MFELLLLSVLLILPVYTISGCATLFGCDMLVINLSTLSFIYFISFFCSKDDEGAKILFLFVVGFIIIVVLLIIAFPDDVSDNILKFTQAYKQTYFDMTPVTSMVLSFIRLIISFTFYSEIDKIMPGNNQNDIGGFKRPEIYLLTSYIAQGINLAFYSLLLILAESGLLGKLIHIIRLKFYAEEDIKHVPMAPVSPINNQQNNLIDSSYSINNVEAPLINKPANIIPLNNNNNINKN